MQRSPEELAAHVVELVGSRAEAQVRVSDMTHGLTRFANSYVHQHVGEQTRSLDLKVAVDNRVASASTTRTDDDGLRSFVEDTLAIAAVAPVDEGWPGMAPAAELPLTSTTDSSTVHATPEQRSEIVRAFVAAADGMNAAGYCETEYLRLGFANSAGQQALAESTRATLDGIHRTDTSAGQGHATARGLDAIDGESAGRRAADLAARGRNPQDPDPDRYEVVLGPEAVSTVMTFLGLYGFNAKTLAEGTSFVRLGEQQFDEQLTLTDDIGDARSIGLPIDVEGTPVQRLPLIVDGVSTAVAYDRRRAAEAGTESTGHAIPGSESFGPLPSSMILTAGGAQQEELIKEVERGLFVVAFNYCRVLDPKTMVVTGLTRNGTFLIEDGELVRPVGNLRFTQSFVDALAPGRVLGVGADARHAEGEFGPGFAHVPSIRLQSWNISGTARG